MIDKFITYKEPTVVEPNDISNGGIIFRTVARLMNGKHILISDANHGSGIYAVDETLVFPCDEEGTVSDWAELGGGRGIRTDEVIQMVNDGEIGYT